MTHRVFRVVRFSFQVKSSHPYSQCRRYDYAKYHHSNPKQPK